ATSGFCSGFRSRVTCKTGWGPVSVSMRARYRRWIVRTLMRCLCAIVCVNDRSMSQLKRLSLWRLKANGQRVVIHDAPIFLLVLSHDAEDRIVDQFPAVNRFTAMEVALAFFSHNAV